MANETTKTNTTTATFNELFKRLSDVEVASFLEEKNGKTYLSWAHCWRILMEHVSEASYVIKRFKNSADQEVPYMYIDGMGYIVYTEVTVEGLTREMWLPVMDSNNEAMLNAPRTVTYKGKDGKPYEKSIKAADIFDINTTIMRCLVKNIAMFGLGIRVYTGEDTPLVEQYNPETGEVTMVPRVSDHEPRGNKATVKLASEGQVNYVKKLYSESEITAMLKRLNVAKLEECTSEQCSKMIEQRANKNK